MKWKRNITKFEKWLLNYLCRKIVTQGNHENRIIEYYSIMKKAAKEEFTEDNKPTFDAFMTDCFNEAQKI